MGQKVIFDPVNKFIIEKPSGTQNTINVPVDIYSDGKEDWLNNVNGVNSFEFPLRPVGGDAVTSTKFVTPRFFLASGWVIKPAELDHELVLEGDLFSDFVPPQPLYVAASGAFTVNIIFNRTFDAFTTIVETSGGGGTPVPVSQGLVPSFM